MSFASKKWCWVALVGLVLTGCASPKSTFYWGDYEELVYEMYMEPGNADSTTQIAKLTADIEKAEAEHAVIAPGVHAHLGYMYALEGNVAAAKSEFTIEKTLFPESATLIDGMLQRLEGTSK